MRFKDLRMRPKLIGSFLLAGLLPLIVVAWFSLDRAEKGMMTQAFQHLETVQKIKSAQIEEYIDRCRNDLTLLARNPDVKSAYRAFEAHKDWGNAGYENAYPIQSDEYHYLYTTYGEYLKVFNETYHYDDTFIICSEHGHVLYTTRGDDDLGQNLRTGPLKGSGLGELWRTVLETEELSFVDFRPYPPREGKPVAFMGAPLRNSNGEITAVVGMQLPMEQIDLIMRERTGMGKSGTSYLVGADGLLRSNSYFEDEEYSEKVSTFEKAGIYKVESEAISAAHKGRSGKAVITHHDGMVHLTCFSPIDIMGSKWASISEIHLSEVQRPIHKIRNAVVIVGIVTICALILFALGIAANVSGPITKIRDLAQKIAKGDLQQQIDIQQDDEVGSLAEAFREMSASLQSKADVARRIAEGDLTVEVPITSARDSLGKAMSEMIKNLKMMNQEMAVLAQAGVEGRLNVRGDTTHFKGEYAKMIQSINETLDAVINPVNESAEVLTRVASRDLSTYVKGRYKGDYAKIKQALNTAVQNLNEGLYQVAMASDQVTSAAAQINAGSQASAQGAAEQASSLEEISSSLQEMSSATKQNALHTKEAHNLADGARSRAKRGETNMQNLSSAMAKIKGSADKTAKIVKTIDEIAFQTNLLALNAAVEAARAGDAGRGFAVVADEVRNLALRSAEAAKTTAQLIEDSVKNADEGVTINEEVTKNLEEINEQIDKVTEVVAEIAEASNQQKMGIEQVSSAVDQLNQLTQQNVTNAEESASTSEELAAQAEELKRMVQGYKLTKEISQTNAFLTTNIYPGTLPETDQPPLRLIQSLERERSRRCRPPRITPEEEIPLDDDDDQDVLSNF
ncbi:MAG: HAMP domain-containing protein [Candidatus Eisenbacteria bacterium]|uniref:HAMP domain-containing protein n=1 Tax=Eiseniibacteriota bacterium TaxID=2212470 RepID=A0A948WCD8_UNCEI|nr:HAMP domain-containing protein [Candidatus Eisenbacteria bacterium]MBU1947474.1 HAMP domain-containing protein [Candidatus Eisenbacteria bacterium]MBU2690833.1 HAMP domain-containing protein [Candidatus Eisenbacteria bacterium]